jgi:hypothetical protein
MGAALGDHTVATRTDIAFTSTLNEIIEPGEEWVDEAGIYHLRGQVEIDDVAGGLTGTATVTINVDANEAEGWFSAWGTIEIVDEAGWWSGTWLNNQFFDGEEFVESGFTILTGHGGNAFMTIAGGLTLADDDSGTATIEGTLQTMAVPHEALTINQDLCFHDDGSISGGFIASGAIEGSGSAQFAAESSGGIWTHTYNLFAITELANEHGTVAIAFMGGAQDGEVYSGAWGPFMILGGDGAYAELYGMGRSVATVFFTDTCASGLGVRVSFVGVAHYNSPNALLLPVE